MNKDLQQLAIYQAESGAIELPIDASRDTIWVSLDQLAQLFGRDKSVISRHLSNVFKDKELAQEPVVAIFATTASDGKSYNVKYYSLDVVLAVGYRVNSGQAMRFRQWANGVLKQFITQGYAINPGRVQNNYQAFLKAVREVNLLSQSSDLVKKADVLELVELFAQTWMSLEAYDESRLPQAGQTEEVVSVTAEELNRDLQQLKQQLQHQGQASDLFAQPKKADALEALIGNIYQTFDGQDVYSTIEEKAAHLLYFLTKNHIFTDGNKRSAAFAFIWYLQKAHLLNPSQLTPTALTALTLLIAESDSKDKDRIVGLVLLLLHNSYNKNDEQLYNQSR